MLEALILACINWPTIWQKIVHWFTSSCMITTSSEQVVYIKYFLVFVLTFKTIYVHNVFWAGSLHVRIRTSMSNLLSYCGLVDARLSASEKDLPVPTVIRVLLPHRNFFCKKFIGIKLYLSAFNKSLLIGNLQKIQYNIA